MALIYKDQAMPQNRDLFGEIVVTVADVDWWLDNISRLPRDATRRRLHYLNGYNVVEKIKDFKASGEFHALQEYHSRNDAKEPDRLGRILQRYR